MMRPDAHGMEVDVHSEALQVPVHKAPEEHMLNGNEYVYRNKTDRPHRQPDA